MNPFRCSNCDKLLGKIEGKAEIKCPKCKTLNIGISADLNFESLDNRAGEIKLVKDIGAIINI